MCVCRGSRRIRARYESIYTTQFQFSLHAASVGNFAVVFLKCWMLDQMQITILASTVMPKKLTVTFGAISESNIEQVS